MRTLHLYIWGYEYHNVDHFLDYAKNVTENDVSLFFLRRKPAELVRQKNVYVFDFPEQASPAWIEVIYNIAAKIQAGAIRIHSAIEYSEKINFPLLKAFHQDVLRGMALTLFISEASFNDVAWRQQFDHLLSKGLNCQQHIAALKEKIGTDNAQWNAIWNYLFHAIADVRYLLADFYPGRDRFFAAPHFRYARATREAADSHAIERVLALSGVKGNTINTLREICAHKKALFFVDDGLDHPLGEAEKDDCLLQAIAGQGFEFLFLLNYTGTLAANSCPGVNIVRLPEAITLETLALAGIEPPVVYGFCSLALFSVSGERVKKLFFHEQRGFPENVRLRQFLRAHRRGDIAAVFVDETGKRLAKNGPAKHIFAIGESMGDALFAVGSVNALRRELVGPFIFIAPKIYHSLLLLCPWIDAVWAPEELDNSRKEALYIAQVQGQNYTPCSGKHIFATQHQIDSILESTGRKNVSSRHKEIVLSVDKIDKSRVDDFIAQHNLTGKVVLIHPNEGVPNRTWPRESWEQLINMFLLDGWSVVLIGANTNYYAHKKTQTIGNDRVFNAIDKFSMGETVYLMTRASLLVACDSGPVALAAATDIAICALYSVVPGKYRLPYRHGELGWNALAVNLACRYQHCAKDYPRDTRGTFDAWCPDKQSYACIRQYQAADFYRAIGQFLDSARFINPLSADIRSAQ